MTTAANTGTVLWKPELSHEGPLYRAIVEALAEDIRRGRLHEGDRLPTQRNLAEALGVGLGTVTRAYREAERLGILSSHVGRGAFVCSPSPSNPLGLPDPQLIEMSVDLPLHAEDPDLAAGLAKVARGTGTARLLRYQNQSGTARHRRAGVAWAERFGVRASPDDVIVCTGSQHATCVALMAATEPGDLVLCDELTYPGIRAVTRQLGLRLDAVAMRNGCTDTRALAAACRQRCVRAFYSIPSFHNPTTGQLDEPGRRRLAKLAREHDFVILEDDVHRLMSDTPPPPIASFAPDHVVSIASFSKAVAGGLRVAFCIPPKSLRTRVEEAVWATVWMASPIPVEVAATWIEDGTADRVIARKRAEATRRQDTCRRILDGFSFAAQPSGFYIWLHLPEPWNSADFAQRARQCGVAVAPSSAFSISGDAGVPAVRVCLAAPESYAHVEQGLGLLRTLLEQGPSQTRPFAP